MNPRIKTAAIVISASALVGTAVHEVFMKDALVHIPIVLIKK